MNNNRKIILTLLTCMLFTLCYGKRYDICVYGGTSSGVMAAYTANKSGKKAILIEPSRLIGGLSAGGLGLTDVGDPRIMVGYAHDFYKRIGAYYGEKGLKFKFEPKAALSVFQQYIEEARIDVRYNTRLTKVDKEGTKIIRLHLENTKTHQRFMVKAKEFIDCSYEGDLMAMAGVSYAIGREPNSQYGETWNGVQMLWGHQFPDGIDPYVVPGDSTSGLLWGILPYKMGKKGEGDRTIQAYNYRITLTDDPANKIEITRPDNYDPKRYELLVRLIEKQHCTDLNQIFIWSLLPNHKTDVNNRGGFSTDMIGCNWSYPEAGYAERDSIAKAHTDYTKGLLYFVGHDERMPKVLRESMLRWGYPKDEYVDNDHFTPALYIRESRRMLGEYVMTQANCENHAKVSDPIGWAAYTMDSHNCGRYVVNGMVKNEGNVEIPLHAPYQISYRSITPKRNECSNLLVPVCLSASHIAYGSIRMEPVFMVLGQAAALAAVQCINSHGIDVQKVHASKIYDTIMRLTE